MGAAAIAVGERHRAAGAAGGLEGGVQTVAELVTAELALFLLVPGRKPGAAQRAKLRGGELAVAVGVAFEERRRHQAGRPEAATARHAAGATHSARATRAAGPAFGLHRCPLCGGEVEMDRPDLGGVEQRGSFLLGAGFAAAKAASEAAAIPMVSFIRHPQNIGIARQNT